MWSKNPHEAAPATNAETNQPMITERLCELWPAAMPSKNRSMQNANAAIAPSAQTTDMTGNPSTLMFAIGLFS